MAEVRPDDDNAVVREVRIEARPETVFASSRTLVSIEPPTRVVFTWGWEGEGNPIPPGASTVEVTLIPDGDGTVLRLVHRDLPPEAQGAHAQGWDHFLPRLVEAAAGRDPGTDPWSERGQAGA